MKTPVWARRVLAEPLVHFAVIGALIFAGASAVKAAQRPTLHIDRAEIAQLAEYWEAQMQRPPSKAELDGLVQERIDEEILAAEAQRLGLDKGDMIIRRRLAQKMAFAAEDVGGAREPDEKTLRAWYQAHQADYRTPTHLALRQVFFSDDRGPGALTAARNALTELQEGRSSAGDPSVLPLVYADVSQDDLARDYGGAFVQAAAGAPVGQWVGPVHSGFGWHLIRVETRRPAATEAFDQVRSDVRDAVLADQRKVASADEMARLRKRYRVEAPQAR